MVCLCSLLLKAQQINYAEYFFDTDPGVGNGTGISIAATDSAVLNNVNIPTTGLSVGFHTLFIRYRYNTGLWGLYEGERTFYIMPANTAPTVHNSQINKAEYFFDTDPGVGNGTAVNITAMDSAVLNNLSVPTTGLSAGFHTLFIRYRGTDGKWGLYEGERTFYVMPANTTPTVHNSQINKAEYFFDTDPGVGNGTAINITATDSAVLNSITAPTTGLSAGTHHLFIRYRGTDGKWGLYQGRQFLVCGSVLAASAISGDTAVCTGTTLSLNGTTVPDASNYIWQGPNSYMATGLSLQRTNVTSVMTGTYTLIAVRTGGTGCDTSRSTVMVIVNQPSASQLSQTICTGASYNFNNMELTQGGVYNDTLTSSMGCDSVVTLTLTVTPPLQGSFNHEICPGSSYTFNGVALTQGGTYKDTVQTQQGCDSIVTLNLTVKSIATSSLTGSICIGDTFSFAGMQLTQGGVFHDTLIGSNMCDSIVTLTLAVSLVDTSVTVDNITLTANSTVATAYQWIDCSNGNVPISGETDSGFTATVDGDYAVIVTEGTCSDTSSCYSISIMTTGINTLASAEIVVVSPNPTTGMLTVSFGSERATVTLMNINGQTISTQIAENIIVFNLNDMVSGIYLLKVQTAQYSKVVRVVKQ